MASADVAFESLWCVLRSSFDGRATTAYARLIRCEPCAVSHAREPEPGVTTVVGFAVTHAERPRELTIAGRHHFSRHELQFTVDPVEAGRSIITATTFASFPGPLGRLYRALVLGSRIHVLVTRRMLRAAASSAERQAS